MDLSTVLLRLCATFLLSFLYGLERQMGHKPIGFGTFTYVSTGASVLAIMAYHLNEANPLPLLGAIITGIGFLGAGALVKSGEKVTGFTSAALIWIFAVFGMAVGLGYYEIGGLTYLVVWFVTAYDRMLEKRGIGNYHKKVSIRTRRLMAAPDISTQLFGKKKHQLIEIDIDKAAQSVSATYLIEGTSDSIGDLVERLAQTEWCVSFRID